MSSFHPLDGITASDKNEDTDPGQPPSTGFRLTPLAITTLSKGAPGNSSYEERAGSMTCPGFDILKQQAADLIWVESAPDLESAKLRLRQLVTVSPGEYVVFDHRKHQIVARSSGASSDPL
jgi:hypothetical protein